jgi:CRISPR-associated protein Cmr3
MNYFIKLTPRGKFFFGGDRTFASTRQSYYAHSEYFPQQTAVLGMLRYSLLKLANALSDSAQAKKAIIGTDFQVKDGLNNFEKIKQLSPVCIVEGTTFWLPAGKDLQWYENKQTKKYQPCQLQKNTINMPPIVGFDHKEWFQLLLAPFIASTQKVDLSKALPLSEFYDEHFQVGNKKERTGISQDDAFFKNDLLSFKRNAETYQSKYAFGFWAEIDADISKLQSVQLGRESYFNVEVMQNQPMPYKLPSNESGKGKVILQSNAYVGDIELLRKVADFVLADSPVPFKFIKSSDSDKHYAMNVQNRKSDQFYLLEQGSVIYTSKLEEVIQLLNNGSFQQIGYNYYKIEK